MKKLFYNGIFITVNDKQPQAEAIFVVDGIIAAIGKKNEMYRFIDAQTQIVDLQGKTVLPGFIDGHGHIANVMAGFPKVLPPPNGRVSSKKILFEVLRKMINEGNILENGWLVAVGYDNAYFEDNSHPTREELDKLSIEIPILILHASGHVGVVNSKALDVIGWTNNTPNPYGGVIQRNKITGELTGLLEENALDIVCLEYVLKNLTVEFQAKVFCETQQFYASQGVTTAQEGGVFNKEMLEILFYCQKHDLMIIDVAAYLWQENLRELIPDNSMKQKYEKHLKIAGSKIVADGSPQAKTAWLTEEYYIKPENVEKNYCGYPIFTDEKMYHFCKEALIHKWQVLVHCNGDATGDQFISAYRKALEESGKNNFELRPVMIHAQIIREDQLDLMKEVGITPSYFHDHVFYWGDYYYESIVGPERSQRISPLLLTVNKGLHFTLHNDMPVTPINPILNIHNAVNRVTRNGRVLGPEYCINVMEAIRALTIYGAYQYFDEEIKGTLEVGKLADLVILDKNPLTVPKETIKDIKVLETIKEGRSIYKYIE